MRIARLFIFIFAASCVLLGGTVNAMDSQHLNQRQKSIVDIAVFTANGNLPKLREALAVGLDSGLSVNEIKELLVQLYAYTGFPRSLNGINTFMSVIDERMANGIKDEQGPEPSPMPSGWNRDEYGARIRADLAGRKNIPAPSGYQVFVPIIDTFLKEHLFADIFSRDNFDHQSRELATIAALGAMSGVDGQLRFHLNAAMNTGLSEAQLNEFIGQLEKAAGKPHANEASMALEKIMAQRKAR